MQDAKKYSTIKYTLALIGIIFNLAFLLIIQFSEASFDIQETSQGLTHNQFLVISLYIFILGLIYYLIEFPLNFYGSFMLEHKFKLSTQKFSVWFNDQLKSLLLGYVIAVILIQTLYFLVRNFEKSWWIITAAAWIFFSFVFTKIFPVIIIPIFFKYTAVEEGELKKRILELAEKFKIKLLDVFEIDFSKKTLKANAAFVGFGEQKRVILADTLKEKYSLDEIEAILAHEFAHYKFKHLWKLFFINASSTLALFYLISKSIIEVIAFFDIYALESIETLPIFLIYMLLFGVVTTPLFNFISRLFEKNADLGAVKATKNTAAFTSMMNKLAQQNLADRQPHPLIKFYFFDHPPIDERIAYVAK